MRSCLLIQPVLYGTPLKPDVKRQQARLAEDGAVSFSMQALEQALISFFEQAARRDEPLFLELEKERRFAFAPDRWCFTLPDLFSFLQQWDETVNAVSYNEFRRAIYASPVNTTVGRFGAEAVIDQNHGHVDKTVYALVWRKRENKG